MAITEGQLETWSHQGSKVQSAATYAKIKSVLEGKKTPYSGRDFEVFLQGSYSNDTNVYAESDVDIVICLTEVCNSDISGLEPGERATYEANRSTPPTGSMTSRRRSSPGSRTTSGLASSGEGDLRAREERPTCCGRARMHRAPAVHLVSVNAGESLP